MAATRWHAAGCIGRARQALWQARLLGWALETLGRHAQRCRGRAAAVEAVAAIAGSQRCVLLAHDTLAFWRAEVVAAARARLAAALVERPAVERPATPNASFGSTQLLHMSASSSVFVFICQSKTVPSSHRGSRGWQTSRVGAHEACAAALEDSSADLGRERRRGSYQRERLADLNGEAARWRCLKTFFYLWKLLPEARKCEREVLRQTQVCPQQRDLSELLPPPAPALLPASTLLPPSSCSVATQPLLCCQPLLLCCQPLTSTLWTGQILALVTAATRNSRAATAGRTAGADLQLQACVQEEFRRGCRR